MRKSETLSWTGAVTGAIGTTFSGGAGLTALAYSLGAVTVLCILAAGYFRLTESQEDEVGRTLRDVTGRERHRQSMGGHGRTHKLLEAGRDEPWRVAATELAKRGINWNIRVYQERLLGADMDVLRLFWDGGMLELERDARAMCEAAKSGSVELIEELIERGLDAHTVSRGGMTPLMLASQKGHTDVMLKLVENGADLDSRSTTGKTAVFSAAQSGLEESLRVLLENGANVDIPNQQGITPLMVAASEAKVGAVRILLGAGADMGAADDYGANVMNYAESARRQNDDVLSVLRDAGAPPSNASIQRGGGSTGASGYRVEWVPVRQPESGTEAPQNPASEAGDPGT